MKATDQEINKIKNLLKSKNFDSNIVGLELARSLKDPVVYKKLLEGCNVNNEFKLINNEISNYLVCALVNDADTPIARKIKKTLKHLDLSASKSLTNVDGLSNFTNLISLSLSGCESLNNVNGLTNLINISSLNLLGCKSLTNIDGLANLINLTELDLISSYDWDNDNLDLTNKNIKKQVDKLASLPNLLVHIGSYNNYNNIVLKSCALIFEEKYTNSKEFISVINKLSKEAKYTHIEINLINGGYIVEECGDGEMFDKYYEFDAESCIESVDVDYLGVLKELLGLLENLEIWELQDDDRFDNLIEVSNQLGGSFEVTDVTWFLDEDRTEEAQLNEDDGNELTYLETLYEEAYDINCTEAYIKKGAISNIKVYLDNKSVELYNNQ